MLAPEPILDTLVRLGVINQLILGALPNSHFARYLISHESGSRSGSRKLSGIVWIVGSGATGSAPVHTRMPTRVRPILNYIASFVWFTVFPFVFVCPLMYHIVGL